MSTSWFYSSFAQVTAAIVGFIGGFLLLRIQQQLGEWRDLALRLHTTQMDWWAARAAIELRTKTSTSVPAELRIKLETSWSDLYKLIKEKELSGFPQYYIHGSLILLAVLVEGVLVPLILLAAPTNLAQTLLLLGWLSLLILFSLFTYVRAREVLKLVTEFPLMESAVTQYQEQEAARAQDSVPSAD